MVRHIITCALLTVCSYVQAGELIIHGLSLHSSPTYTYEHTTHYTGVDPQGNVINRYDVVDVTTRTFNSINVGVGYRTDNNWAVGAYWNSYRKPTVYFGKGVNLIGNFGVFVGGATGYQDVTGHKITPVAALEYKLPISNQHGLRVAAIPKVGDSKAVITTALYKEW